MQPRIENIPDRKLIGQHVRMSLAQNRTVELWKDFMPRRKEIIATGSSVYDIKVYDIPLGTFTFTPHSEFEKWAAVEVANFDSVPVGMKPFVLPGGTYAVFLHHGPVSTFQQTWNYIFQTWLPASSFSFDGRRPHFEILEPGYKPTDPDAQEEVWIPVKPSDSEKS